MQLILVERGLRTRFLLPRPVRRGGAGRSALPPASSQPVRRPDSTYQFTYFVRGMWVQLLGYG